MSMNKRKSAGKVQQCGGNEQRITMDEIKLVFHEMFKNFEKSIADVIAANNKITNDRIEKLTKHISDLQYSLEFVQEETKNKIAKIEETMMMERDFVREKLRDFEDRSRRNNLRIDGLNESEKETWEDTEEKVQQIFRNNLGLEATLPIERAHRTGKVTEKKKSRTVVLKMLSYKDRNLVLKNAHKLKGTDIYINEDYSYETTEIRRKLWNDVLKLRLEGKFAILRYDKIIQRDNYKT